MVFLLYAIWVLLFFENLERAIVSLLMLSAKPGNHWYYFFLTSNIHMLLLKPLYDVGQKPTN